MTILSEKEVKDSFLRCLIEVAKESTCRRSKCGSIIVDKYNSRIIGWGYNSQPCKIDGICFKDDLPGNFKSDKTCCVHAEQRAIMDALRNFPDCIQGSSIWFLRLDENNEPKWSGEPYCTICSKMALDVGISKFMLWRKDGWREYPTSEYNKLSFQFKP